MKFALVNGHKREPQPELKGICVNCLSDTLAKCGRVKIWHWAHKSKISCDPWWENETEWHRTWKNHFPTEWQENIHVDYTTGEKHIADIKTGSGLVIEFQHSAIRPIEIQSREAFYKNMVWVVDGTRLKRDYPRFRKGFKDLNPLIQRRVFRSFYPKELLPESWVTSSVPVYFDFHGTHPTDELDDNKLSSSLWCLFPRRGERDAVIARVSRKEFIEFSSSALHLLFPHEILSKLSESTKLLREISAAQNRRHYWQPYNPRKRRHL